MLTDTQIEAKRDAGETARYAGFWSKLDCNLCSGEIEVEGDVSNGEIVECPDCGASLAVESR